MKDDAALAELTFASRIKRHVDALLWIVGLRYEISGEERQLQPKLCSAASIYDFYQRILRS